MIGGAENSSLESWGFCFFVTVSWGGNSVNGEDASSITHVKMPEEDCILPRGEIMLVIGGARSGKSEWAEELVKARGDSVIYVATAGINDAEMAERVRRHRERRPAGWRTVEETHQLAGVLNAAPAGSVVLIDCLTVWMSNLLLDESLPRRGAAGAEKEEYILQEAGRIVDAARRRELYLVMVSNEVGCGLVPDNALGRLYRDIAGRVNRRLAELADRVYYVVAGIPLDLQALAITKAKGRV
ncbi:bifunctional adenosylcobinamide kinase/adenosylcobinamide-phosphate guanylyltransferase [Desulfoscipio geothermicus]|uniref:Adenosylcobinamide kinase n=1 Tax=Desulfoscipio geothermicus DSM 3669 TaxID=1121426 RepID=A0A1I6D9D4_9FIRM|nr:bifunctional adenosylcobinamide kinase/adenosylcobinamide-phosphate guanylyltransferase [Desulfoscipio geothermicus]SFR01942.1 adenosylcobinamide kinase /adenosylcobinamide-phosphate guanylyltransferase [Desulfoscipio geothermicus DSM 3669]